MFASGTVINGFTPTNKFETDSLVQAIRLFKVKVVLVIDHEKLERDIATALKDDSSIKIIKVPKSPGI